MKLRPRSLLPFTLVCALFLGAPPALAAHPPLGKALTGHAKSDYEAGKMLAQTGDFSGALIKFKSAYDDSKDPRLLWNMAACEKSLHHYAATADLLDRYLDEGAHGWLTAQDHDDAESIQEAVRALYGKVSVHMEPKDASAALDGKPVTLVEDEPLRVDLGKHVLRVTKPGYEAQERAFETTGDDRVQVRIVLDRAAAGGTLAVRAAPGDMISIDGKAVGVGNVEIPVTAGVVHDVRVSADGKDPREVPVTVHEGERKAIELQAEARSSHTWMFIAGGAALAVGAGVAGFLLLRPHSSEQGPATPGSIPPGTVNLP